VRPLHRVGDLEHHQHAMATSADQLLHINPDSISSCQTDAPPELRRVQAELGARHSFREAAELLSMLLPCSPTNHATIRNRTHRVAAEIEANAPEAPKGMPTSNDELIVMIDRAHIRAAPGYQTRHLDVTVGKVEVSGRQPRRFALAPEGSDHPLAPMRAALVEQGWHPGRPLAVISDGEAALPNLVPPRPESLCATFWIGFTCPCACDRSSKS
jgi:hypothetical protein